VSAADDREAIRDLIARYAHAADDGRSADYAALFVEDGVMESQGARRVGRAELAALIDGIYDYSIKHLQLNTSIQLAGDRATAQTDLQMLAMDPGGAWQITGCARYEDDLVRASDGNWLFAKRNCVWHRNTPSEVLAQLNALLEGTPKPAAV
jgi:uncharacterized protein (TIGR02246 family)